MKILVVDDDANIRMIAAMGLESDEITLLEADSGEQALKIAVSETPDVILLDMMMPVMDGKLTLSRLKDDPRTKNIPVIFCTAKVQAQEVEAYLKLGVAGLIMKPFDPITLPDEIVEILEKFESATDENILK